MVLRTSGVRRARWCGKLESKRRKGFSIARENALLQLKPIKGVDGVANLNSI